MRYQSGAVNWVPRFEACTRSVLRRPVKAVRSESDMSDWPLQSLTSESVAEKKPSKTYFEACSTVGSGPLWGSIDKKKVFLFACKCPSRIFYLRVLVFGLLPGPGRTIDECRVPTRKY